MNQRAPEKIIPFAPTPRDQRQQQPNDGDPIDRSGHAIVTMLQQAVDVAQQNCERAMDIAHKLSLKLREAEDRIAQLEGQIRHYQDRADRAEKWMHRIHSEIEDRFFTDSAAPNGSGRR
jgi:DNA repair ATPase RecN